MKKLFSILLVTGYTLLVTASVVNAAIVPCDIGPAGGVGPRTHPCTVCDFFVLIKNIVDFLTEAVAMPVAVIILIYGGIMLLTSGGSEDKIRKGKSALWQAVWGLVIVFAAWLIIDTIIKWLANPSVFLFGPWNKIPMCG